MPTLRRGLRAAAAAVIIAGCGSDAPATSPPATSPPGTSAPATISVSTEANATQVARPATTTSEATDSETSVAVESAAVEPPAEGTLESPSTATCRRVTDFDTGDGWVVVNDGVMGGRSAGAIEFVDSTMRFTGEIVTAGGGFTSVRLPLVDDELADTDALALRVRADQRIYGLTLADNSQAGRRTISHGADLAIDGPSDADGWQIVVLDHEQLQPSVFGQPLDAPPFDPDAATEIGIIIGDGVDGPFALEVDWIDACGSP